MQQNVSFVEKFSHKNLLKIKITKKWFLQVNTEVMRILQLPLPKQKSIDSARLMATWLSYLADNLADYWKNMSV